MKQLLRNFLLLLLAFISLATLFIPAFIIQTVRHIVRATVSKFFFGLAISIDYIYGYLLFGVFGLTVSTMTYKYYIEKGKLEWFMNFINWIFQDDNHCKNSYYDDLAKGKLTEEFQAKF